MRIFLYLPRAHPQRHSSLLDQEMGRSVHAQSSRRLRFVSFHSRRFRWECYRSNSDIVKYHTQKCCRWVRTLPRVCPFRCLLCLLSYNVPTRGCRVCTRRRGCQPRQPNTRRPLHRLPPCERTRYCQCRRMGAHPLKLHLCTYRRVLAAEATGRNLGYV